MANVGNAGDGRRPIGKQGDRGKRLHRVADGVHVDADATKVFTARWADNGNCIVGMLASSHFAAHLLQAIAEGHVPLQAVAIQSLYGQFAAGDRRGCKEIAGCRCVGLDFITIYAAILAWRDSKMLKIIRTYIDPKRPHNGQRHFDIRFRNQGVFDDQFDRILGVRRRHQQAA